MARLVSPALRAMLSGAIDYAGCFPPASLTLTEAADKYRTYRAGCFSWMLGRFVVRHQDVDSVPADLDGSLAVVGSQNNARATAIETQSVNYFDKPTYCEVNLVELAAVRKVGGFAKLRTGGVFADAIPSTESVAAFIAEYARLNLPFKATAGLHHPIRSVQRLTYAPDSAAACMHGFINVLFASCCCYAGADSSLVTAILAETQADAFRFDEEAHWRSNSLTVLQIEQARRNFVHSFGSCSFHEPITELERLGWL